MACSASMKAADAAQLLGLGDGVQSQGRLARRLGAVDLDDAAAREAADAERDVEESEPVGTVCRSAAGGVLAHAHDAAFAELALDLGDGGFEGFVPIHSGHSSLCS